MTESRDDFTSRGFSVELLESPERAGEDSNNPS